MFHGKKISSRIINGDGNSRSGKSSCGKSRKLRKLNFDNFPEKVFTYFRVISRKISPPTVPLRESIILGPRGSFLMYAGNNGANDLTALIIDPAEELIFQ